MLFIDHLYGTIDFRGTPYADLIYELIGCPEVQRLRHMRLMNFDVPYIQDLASTKRFPHSIGTCFLAYKTVEKSALPINEKKKIIVAALIHDIGILPFGHLLESIIKSRNQNFSHEKLVHSILTGTYHATNIYHQILGSESLRLPIILRQNKIKPDDIFDLICPPKGRNSAISADIDFDNIDNVHRMATLVGYEKAKSNLNAISDNITIDNKNRIVFSEHSRPFIEQWLKMRQSIYTMIIGHPECVPYNAFLSKLLTTAIDGNLVNQDEWFITDQLFETRMFQHKLTHQLATWLYIRPHYELVDYIWFISNDKPNISLNDIEKLVVEQNFSMPKQSSSYFFWSENKLISREITFLLPGNRSEKIGNNSHSILISLITKSDYRLKAIKVSELRKNRWRTDVLKYIMSILPDWKYSVKFPSDYNDNYFNSIIENEQLKLFKY